jgi:hypothetical protein
MWRRVLAGILGTLAVLAGAIACGYALMASDDFSNSDVSFWIALLGTGIIWLLTLGAFAMGIHFLKYCVTGKFFQVNPWARALVLGALSFFPGFIVSAIPAMLLVSKSWPREARAENVAILTSIFLGAALAVVVCVALIRTRDRNDATPPITVDKSPFH